ncbi:MAG: long-chain fatty acid--CoA ligase [Nitrospirae bacterium]|nr:long-chain fatty acid--CoA ligase [Nitrospirota bacterium]
MDRVWTSQYDPHVPSTLSYPEEPLPQMLARSAARFPDRPAILFYGRVIRYRELDVLVNRFAQALLRMGIGKGSVVGIMLPNLPQTVIAFYGSLRAGATVTMINPLYVEPEIRQQVTDSGCETLLTLGQFYSRVEPLLRHTCLKRVLVTGVEDYLPWFKKLLYPLKAWRDGLRVRIPVHPAVHAFRRLLDVPPEPPTVPVAPDDTALLQYTGGTTGVPKGVVLTHRNLMANTWQIRQWFPAIREGEEVFLGVLPFFHVYGMSVCQNLSLCTGSALVLLPRFQLGEVLKAIVRERVTVFPGIPAMYSAINGYQRLDRYNLRSVRVCISGAGPLPPSVQERFESLTGAKLVEGYGLTEASPVTHANPIEQTVGRRHPKSMGLPLPDTDARIVDVETGRRELPIGEIGELVLRGPQVMCGYWRRDEETRQVLRDGWLYTGDMARRDADGYFYIEDRKKDMIKSGGENVYPREVEEVLLRHPKVKDAAVAGIPQELRGELIKAYVVLKDGETATSADLLEHCRRNLAKFKVPKRVEFRSELPKTIVGKVLRRVLVDEELKRRRTPGADEASE